MSALYAAVLGDGWGGLAPSVRRLHGGGGRGEGTFRVRRGATILARLLAWLLRMPRAADAVTVTLRVASDATGERWTRSFGGAQVETLQWLREGLLVEAFGLVQCVFRLRVLGGGFMFEQVASRFGGRRFAVPLPRLLAPRIEGRCDADGDSVRVDVAILAPVVGLLVGYEGRVHATEPGDST
jgi:hypothetical protein